MSSSRPHRDAATRGRPRKQPDPPASQSDRETEPATKRQKLNKLDSFEIIDIYARGDLFIQFESRKIAYRVDSNAIERASPDLYQKCLAVKPNGPDTPWTFNGIPEIEPVPAELVLNLMHSNLGRLPVSLPWAHVHKAVSFVKDCGILDPYRVSLRQWFHTMEPSKDVKARNCSRLWLAHTLELENEFKDLQNWAIYNLCDNGKGDLGDPVEQMWGQPLSLHKMPLADKAIADEIGRLRLEAVNLILMDLLELQKKLITPSKDAPSCKDVSKRFPCQFCLDSWYAFLQRSLRCPGSIDFSLNTLSSLAPIPLPNDYGRSMEELCVFVDELGPQLVKYVREDEHYQLVLMMASRRIDEEDESEFCSARKQKCKVPRRLVSRKDVERLLDQELGKSINAN